MWHPSLLPFNAHHIIVNDEWWWLLCGRFPICGRSRGTHRFEQHRGLAQSVCIVVRLALLQARISVGWQHFLLALLFDQLAVVDDIVRNDILLYFTTLCCDYIVSALARCNENKTAVCVAFDTVIDINHAPVGHHHWHLDRLEQAASAFDIWELYEADFVIYFRELNWQGISERLVLCVSQAGH